MYPIIKNILNTINTRMYISGSFLKGKNILLRD